MGPQCLSPVAACETQLAVSLRSHALVSVAASAMEREEDADFCQRGSWVKPFEEMEVEPGKCSIGVRPQRNLPRSSSDPLCEDPWAFSGLLLPSAGHNGNRRTSSRAERNPRETGFLGAVLIPS